MSTYLQPYPIVPGRPVGLLPAVLSPLPERAALIDWCRKHVGGFFHLVKRTEQQNRCTLYEAWRPGADVRYKFVVEAA